MILEENNKIYITLDDTTSADKELSKFDFYTKPEIIEFSLESSTLEKNLEDAKIILDKEIQFISEKEDFFNKVFAVNKEIARRKEIEELIKTTEEAGKVVDEKLLEEKNHNDQTPIENIELLDKNWEESILMTNIKKLDRTIKTELVRYFLSREDIVDPLIVLNLYDFVGGDMNISKNKWENPNVYWNKMTEIVDIKSKLREEFNHFKTEICKYYLSILKCCNEVETVIENMIVIPGIYQQILMMTNFDTLAKLLNSIEPININETYMVNNATFFLDNLAYKQVMKKEIVTLLESDIKE